MAFWDDWDFEIDWNVAGWTLATWAVMGLILFKMPMMMGDMSQVKLAGMSWEFGRVIVWVLSLPISYLILTILFNRD